MATVATTVIIDGKLDVPSQALKAARWPDGSRIDVVETGDGLLLRPATPPPPRGAQITWDELMEENKLRLGLSPDYKGWRALEGILADDLVDSLHEKHRLRDEELAHDQQKFNS